MQRILRLILPLFLIGFIYGQNNEKYIQWWLYNHGDYAKTRGQNDPRVQQAFAVFERVKNTADKVASRSPRLFITNAAIGPCAIALPDGGIIINRKTLDICYPEGDVEKGDLRTAFILGHELAHLANNDFLHREAFLALKQFGDKKANRDAARFFEFSGREKTREAKRNELMADKMGALYASMAGYDMSELFGKDDHFFSHWVKQNGIGSLYDEDEKHPAMEKRLLFIRSQLRGVVQQLELFNGGVLLFQGGKYHDAAAAFFEFSKVYPAREVFNNIAACYFNLALKRLFQLNSEVYYRFRVSTSIDYATSAGSILRLRGKKDYLEDNIFSRNIDKAEQYFKQAVERDSENASSRCNLAAALILKGEYAGAQVECDDVLKKYPGDVNAMNNKAIAFYYYGRAADLDTTQKAIQLLHEAHQIKPDHFEVLYNLASLKEKRERQGGAEYYWKKYLNISPKDHYYRYVHKKVKDVFPAGAGRKGKVPKLPASVEIGDEVSRVEKKWRKPGKNTNIREYELGKEQDKTLENWLIDMQVIVKDNWRVLGLDGRVEIIEEKLRPAKGLAEILRLFGAPGNIVRHTSGNFYVYKDRGFSFKEVNGKVQAYIWFGKGF